MTVEVPKFGPQLRISESTHAAKYRMRGEDFYAAMSRISAALHDSEEHRKDLKNMLLDMRFLPAGRVQCAVGTPQRTTAFNCFVSGEIEDSMIGIMHRFTEAALTMRQGGGIGYDFSHIRPNGSNIVTLNSPSSGPVSFMHIGDAVCGTVSSAGHRRGAQMAVLRIDHPDIELFITAKQNERDLTRYNISVAVTDEFMQALENNEPFPLKWKGQVVRFVSASSLWDLIMRNTWDWAEPGILFIDRINKWNNLWYCETIAATNPCGEQPLPPYGACLLGSFNLVKYVHNAKFDYNMFKADIATAVRAMDNVIDETIFPLPEQESEAKSKRRMGLGVTGTANAIEAMGFMYGTDGYIEKQDKILACLQRHAYLTSTQLAKEKGAFPLYDADKYLAGNYIKSLPADVRKEIREHGIRNSHLLSIAPTGTISITADNISSGIEPVFSYGYDRTIQTPDGAVIEYIEDYGHRVFGTNGRTSDEVPVADHIRVLIAAQKYIDSSCSKTCNVGDNIGWEEFKNVYISAYKGGAKGVTTFRAAGRRYGILNKRENVPVGGEACFIDPKTGEKECG